MIQERAIARADGHYAKLLTDLANTDLVLDDWGMAPFTHEGPRNLLDIHDDRFNRRSTLVTSQLPIEHWRESIGGETLADAILDRLQPG